MRSQLFTSCKENASPRDPEDFCRELEDAYAEAFKDEADIRTLNSLWRRIQVVRGTLAAGHTSMADETVHLD